MKIVVTGATGFLGKRVAYRLKELGYFPIGVGRNSVVGNQLITAGIPFLNADLSNKDQSSLAFEKADYVIHCAGLSSVWGKASAFENANVVAVKNIIESCIKHNVKRIVHISTPSLYFDFQHKYQITEQDALPVKFVNHYASSKKKGEELVVEANSFIETVILRPRGIFGPGDTSIFPRILNVMEKSHLPLIEEGKALMDITYIDNVVDAIILALFSKRANGQTYNITNDEPLTFIELLQLLSYKLNIPLNIKNVSFNKAYYSALTIESIYKLLRIKAEPPITTYGVGLLSKSMTFDITKAKQELDYLPKISISEGFDLFANWWKSRC